MKTIHVSLAESRASDKVNEALAAIGLGSCVAVVLYDPLVQVGGLAHVMLPAGSAEDKPAKFATTAVPHLVEEVTALGATPANLRAGVFGGATLLATGQSALLQIGERNIQAVELALRKADLVPVISDVGGTKGRTVALAIDSGEITVKVLGQPDRVFVDLTPHREVPR